MHILIGFLTLLAGAAFWIYRMRDAGRAVGEVVDAAERARGYWRRKKFLSKAEGSVVTAIDDPVVGAAVMMVAVASLKGAISDEANKLIMRQQANISGRDPTEDITFAKWVVDQSSDPDNISLKLASVWNAKLTDEQRRELVPLRADRGAHFRARVPPPGGRT